MAKVTVRFGLLSRGATFFSSDEGDAAALVKRDATSAFVDGSDSQIVEGFSPLQIVFISGPEPQKIEEKFSPERVAWLRTLRELGRSWSALSKDTGIPQSTLRYHLDPEFREKNSKRSKEHYRTYAARLAFFGRASHRRSGRQWTLAYSCPAILRPEVTLDRNGTHAAPRIRAEGPTRPRIQGRGLDSI